MTVCEANTHVVDATQLEIGIFLKDDDWINLFNKKFQAFYNDHLMWFYNPQFDNEAAFKLLNSLLTKDNTSATAHATKKRKLK